MQKAEITQYISNETQMLFFANKLATAIKQFHPQHLIIFLYGDLGAGKTTFTRGMLRTFGHQEKVKSPTYTLVEPYDLDDYSIFHFDLYRLVNPDELDEIGLQEYIACPTSISIFEWPQNGISKLPLPDLTCYIQFKNNGRDFTIEANSELGKKILKQI